MPTTINGVSCEEIVDGLQEAIDDRGPRATKKWLCAWADRYALANGLLGFVSHTGGVGGSVTFTRPQPYPDSANLWAREIAIEGKGRPTQGARQIQFTQAIVTATYGVPEFGVLSTPEHSVDPTAPLVYATQEIDIGLDSYTIPASAVTVGGAAIARDVTIPYARAEIAITLHRFPWLPAQTILNLAGSLNSAVYLGCAVGKLRFNGGKTHMTASTDGTYTQDVTLSFSFRKIARWDYRFHPNGTSGWVALQDKSSNNLFTLADFSPLIPSAYFF